MKEIKMNIEKAIPYLMRYIGIPVILELIIESLNRKSILSSVQYLFQRPMLFIFNTLIIMLTVSIALFFKREIFVFTTISIVWLIFGIVNFIILSFRVTPFSAVDITLLESAISVSGHYLNVLNIAMIFVAVIVVFIAIICLFRMAPKHTHTTQKKLIFSVILIALIVSTMFFLRNKSNSVQALTKNYTNISEAYENYGFVYCFTNSIIDSGIKEPENYDQNLVDGILTEIPEQKTESKKPNIIFVQLESFFDVATLKNLKLSADPIPNFHNLQKKYSSGLLTVPTVGAGTVNTEFEVLTGMSQKDFGTSEYPYKTVLRDTTSESICYDLKKLGYASHCVHNNEGTFYGRNKVFENLGFDTFTSMEYMNGLEDNPNGWKKDSVLTKEIMDTLDSTTESDFVLGITVQSHGKYDGFDSKKTDLIQVQKAPKDKVDAYQYYINQLREVDEMIGDLVSALNSRKEKTILVFYGDHLPSLDIKKEDLKDSNLYQTQYVVWNNFGLQREEKNVTSYELYPEILNRCGIHEGIITRFQQNMKWKTKSYHEKLKTLEYDLLYGKKYQYNEANPFQPTKLQMGTKPIVIKDVARNEEGYMVTGEGFTPFCHVMLNGDEISTKWVDSSHIQIMEELKYDSGAEKDSNSETPSPTASISPKDEQNQKEKTANAFLIQIQTDGGTVLSDSELKYWKDTSLGK